MPVIKGYSEEQQSIEDETRKRLAGSFKHAMRHKGWSINKLAAAMESCRGQVKRILCMDSRGGSITLRTLIRTAHALDLELHVYLSHKPREK